MLQTTKTGINARDETHTFELIKIGPRDITKGQKQLKKSYNVLDRLKLMKAGEVRISGLIAGPIVLFLGALMIAEAVSGIVAGASFMFADNINRGFEFVVGFMAIVLGYSVMDEDRR